MNKRSGMSELKYSYTIPLILNLTIIAENPDNIH